MDVFFYTLLFVFGGLIVGGTIRYYFWEKRRHIQKVIELAKTEE